MKPQHLYDRAVTGLFLLLLFLPLTLLVIADRHAVSGEEKRRLADLPELKADLKSIAGFPGHFEKFFNDQFPLRTTLTRLRNRLDILFHASPSPLVVAGRDGWYFFKGDNAINEYMGQVNFSPLQLRRAVQLLRDRREWLATLGCRYIFLPVPNKELIYGEFLPRAISTRKGTSKYEQLAAELDAEGFADWLDIAALFTARKPDGQLYLKTDSHWNTRGSLVTFNAIVKKAQLPGFEPLEESSPTRWIANFSGDLAFLMGLRGVVTEKAPDFNFKTVCQPVPMQRMHHLPGAADRTVPAHRKPIYGGCPEAKIKVIMIHDSFGKPFNVYLSQRVKKVIFIHHFNFETAKALIAREKPDLVIDERVSRNLQKALVADGELEQEMVMRHFSQHEEVVAVWSGDGAADSPVFELPGETVAAKIGVTAASAGKAKLCFTAEQKKPECIKRQLKKGQNLIYTRLFMGGKGRFSITGENRLRLDTVELRRASR